MFWIVFWFLIKIDFNSSIILLFANFAIHSICTHPLAHLHHFLHPVLYPFILSPLIYALQSFLNTEESLSALAPNQFQTMSNSPQKPKPTYREIYESQNDCSVSGVAIKINCENCDNHLTVASSSGNELQCPMPSSSSGQSSSFHENVASQKNGSNKLFSKQPQTSNPINNALDDDIIELPEVEYPIVEPIVIRGKAEWISIWKYTRYDLAKWTILTWPNFIHPTRRWIHNPFRLK